MQSKLSFQTSLKTWWYYACICLPAWTESSESRQLYNIFSRLFGYPMQCSVFTSQKHPKHHFERHKVINFTMDCQWAQHSFCNLHPQPGGDSQSHLWTSGCLTGCSEAAWVGESLVGHWWHWWLVRLKKKTRIKINVQVSQVLQMSCALLGALARDFLSHKILTMIEISSL